MILRIRKTLYYIDELIRYIRGRIITDAKFGSSYTFGVPDQSLLSSNCPITAPDPGSI